MARLVLTELGQAGINYVREHLTGVNVFCTALLAAVEAAPGKAMTLAPPGATPARLKRFAEGGLRTGLPRLVRDENDDADASLKVEQAAYLISVLRTAPDGACIVDDFEPSWDIALSDEDPHAFGVGDEVYRLFTADDAPAAIVRALVKGDNGWHGVAAVCDAPPELNDDRECTEVALQGAALSVIALTCTAYDGEGFVIWRRS